FLKESLNKLPMQVEVALRPLFPNAWGCHARLLSVVTGGLMQEAKSSRVISGIHTYLREESNDVPYQGFCSALPADAGGADVGRHRFSWASCSLSVTSHIVHGV